MRSPPWSICATCLGSGGVWVEGSRAYRTLDDYLLPPAAFEAMRAEGSLGVAVEVDVSRWLGEPA